MNKITKIKSEKNREKENKKQANKDKIIETLYKELERKDKLIEKLKEENYILMKTALKNAEKKLKESKNETKN